MAYSLSQSYFGANLISDFNFINYADPSNGFVRYQSQPDALSKGLYFIDPDTQAVTLGVDNKNTYGLSDGRPSLRLESKRQYNHGLFIGDFAHMPPSVCGLWPAFWMYGPDWPTSGEIDIIEGANQATKNIISGHSTSGCRIPDSPAAAGQPLLLDCESPGTTNNAGCNYLPPASDTHTYGDAFNAVGGGVYALEWTSEAISIWHWPRQSIPDDIIAKNPDPSGWGLPSALFGTSTCDVDTYFKDMSIVIQTVCFAPNCVGILQVTLTLRCRTSAVIMLPTSGARTEIPVTSGRRRALSMWRTILPHSQTRKSLNSTQTFSLEPA
ncbi:mixed-linked glucanase [Colletotrichum fioriniae PJ7]|uniref:Mixed-linked glucanase n=1 Tax=Colletotrichum fioriniae PJ7 TaxID=1445577 RepID=A0A010S721_9PEZI|nr:mixed-linked glucanase [Colletotrichum fioriniae PJ7]